LGYLDEVFRGFQTVELEEFLIVYAGSSGIYRINLDGKWHFPLDAYEM